MARSAMRDKYRPRVSLRPTRATRFCFSHYNESTPMDLHLRGKRVLITGASKGIGAAAAEAFAEEGCDLRLAARNGDQLNALADRLRSAHQVAASVHVTDLRKPEDLARLAKDASDIDILV